MSATEELAAGGTWEWITPGKHILENDIAEMVYVIARGQLIVEREDTEVASLRAGDAFGDFSLSLELPSHSWRV